MFCFLSFFFLFLFGVSTLLIFFFCFCLACFLFNLFLLFLLGSLVLGFSYSTNSTTLLFRLFPISVMCLFFLAYFLSISICVSSFWTIFFPFPLVFLFIWTFFCLLYASSFLFFFSGVGGGGVGGSCFYYVFLLFGLFIFLLDFFCFLDFLSVSVEPFFFMLCVFDNMTVP